MKLNLEIEIDLNNLKIDEKYFSFYYNIKINWVIKIKENYSSDYSWYKCKEDFIKQLKEWRAYQCVLDECDIRDYI